MHKINMGHMLLFVLCCWSWQAVNAASGSQGNWEVHGFMAQGLVQSEDTNYINDEGDISYRLTEVGINGLWRFKPNLSLAGQVTYLNADNRYEEGVRLDYLFLKWTLFADINWNVDFYAGRYKNYHWLDSATIDVPMARPTIILPQSVYFDGSRDIGVGSDGAGMTVNYFGDLGELEFNWSYGSSTVSHKQLEAFITPSVKGSGEQDYALQFSLYWQPELSDVRWGLSYLESEFEYDSTGEARYVDAGLRTQRYFGNFRYSRENWELSSEIFFDNSEHYGLFFPGYYNNNYGIGGYLQLRYYLDKDWLLTVRQDKFFRDKDDKQGNDLEAGTGGAIPAHFGFQHDLTLGISYDFATRWRLMAELHFVEGTARTLPITVPNVEINNEKHWETWAMQVMYWF